MNSNPQHTPLNHTYAVVMAGGVGSRFWPKSRESKPKQYLSLLEDGTLIQNTVTRLLGLVDEHQLIVVTTESQKELLIEQLPWVPQEHILYEPFGKNTAPAIGLAAIHLFHQDPQSIMVVAPADHRITKTKTFLSCLRTAIATVEQDPEALVTLGVPPTYPATGYGYIHIAESTDLDSVFHVQRFTEKPPLDRAEDFVRQGTYYWNSGIFVWKAATLLSRLHRFMPNLYQGLQRIAATMEKAEYSKTVHDVYAGLESKSIDYGVMEKAKKHVYMVRADCGWSDLGTWQEVYKNLPKDKDGNAVKGKPLLKDVKNSYIESHHRTVSVIGVSDLIVVDEPDALLICKLDHSQDVRWVKSQLDQNK